jgi:hypothetical protein
MTLLKSQLKLVPAAAERMEFSPSIRSAPEPARRRLLLSSPFASQYAYSLPPHADLPKLVSIPVQPSTSFHPTSLISSGDNEAK